MSVLFGFSKQQGISQFEAFSMAAAVVGVLSFFTLCLVRNPKIKVSEETVSQVRREEELQAVLVRDGDHAIGNSINSPQDES